MAEDTWELEAEKKKKARQELEAWAAAFMVGLAESMVDNLPELITEGAAWGGGGLDEDALVEQMTTVLESQGEYADDFLKDINERIDEVLGGKYADQESFVDEMMDMFEWAKSRAESYAVGSGIPAWRDATMKAMRRNKFTGGQWICTFGPGSCEDCKALHGEWLSNDELEATWGTTECNGACLCGFMPTDEDDTLSEDDMGEVDDTLNEDNLEDESAA